MGIVAYHIVTNALKCVKLNEHLTSDGLVMSSVVATTSDTSFTTIAAGAGLWTAGKAERENTLTDAIAKFLADLIF